MEQITQIIQRISNFGVSALIVGIFLWDYVTNKKTNIDNQEIIKNTLTTVEETSTTIANCLREMQQQNINTSKSLDLLQQQMENTDKKIDILLERRI